MTGTDNLLLAIGYRLSRCESKRTAAGSPDQQMFCCDLCPGAGNSDKPTQALLASLNASLERTFWAQSGIPFDRIGEAMELNEIKTLHAHAFKRAMDVAFGRVIGPAASLSC